MVKLFALNFRTEQTLKPISWSAQTGSIPWFANISSETNVRVSRAMSLTAAWCRQSGWPDSEIEFKSTNWMGPGGHFVHYYVSSGRYLNFVAVTEQSNWTRESWTDRADLAEVHAYYENWHPQIHAVLDGVEATFKWALFDREPLNAWSKGRVTLLGDACHPMLPYMAQGAAQAIEDGAALAACLRQGRSEKVADLLREYEAIRQPRTAAIQALARQNSKIFHLPDGPDQQQRDRRMAARRSERNPSGISSARARIFGHDAEVLPSR